jgi:hypothetical protein
MSYIDAASSSEVATIVEFFFEFEGLKPSVCLSGPFLPNVVSIACNI